MIGRILRRLTGGKFNSARYWQRRYERGGNSGAGSYGRLAEYKAKIVNSIVEEKGVESVVEIGCGDGNQARLFNISSYMGVDVSPLVIQAAREKFSDRRGWSFETIENARLGGKKYDMAMSLDVIYHLVEDDVYNNYMIRLFECARHHVLIYASNHDEFTENAHVRHRCYTDWISRNAPQFSLEKKFDHPYPFRVGEDERETSFAFFQLFSRTRS